MVKVKNRMKQIAIFTGNRAEYGLQIPILRAIDNHPDLEYYLIVSGAHLDPTFGSTVKEIESDGFTIHEKIDIGSGGTDLVSTSEIIGNAIIKLTRVIKKCKPDIFLVYADRFESFAATIASSQTNTVTAHVEGGDITEGGALDDNVRHAMTKLSHLHYVTNKDSYHRVKNMGEEDWRIELVGYPAIDLIANNEFISEEDICNYIDIDINKPILIFTQHSVTNKFQLVKEQLIASIKGIKKISKERDIQCIFTYPNNDAGGIEIFETINNHAKDIENVIVRKSLGRRLYWGLLNLSKDPKKNIICIGNSSSGIKETATFNCPTINIGSRQKGRLRSTNIIDCDYSEEQIYMAIKKCLDDDIFKEICARSVNPYGLGGAGQKIANHLATIKFDDKLLTKKMTI
jgi:UDP-N-acetylglucosamine 2-epimerase (non-hydrolysing)/GDP/UDP-N,N'-diacetylbacillosamine 2-epimerase (hydrolysing)